MFNTFATLIFGKKEKKDIQMRNVTTKLGVEAYETPSCSVVEICFEGVLCLSGQHEGLTEDGGGDIFEF